MVSSDYRFRDNRPNLHSPISPSLLCPWVLAKPAAVQPRGRSLLRGARSVLRCGCEKFNMQWHCTARYSALALNLNCFTIYALLRQKSEAREQRSATDNSKKSSQTTEVRSQRLFSRSYGFSHFAHMAMRNGGVSILSSMPDLCLLHSDYSF
jgi:hypothetical protein